MWSCSHKKCFIKSPEFRDFHILPHFQRSRSNCKTKYNFHFSNCFLYFDNNPLQWMTVWSRVSMDIVKWKTFSLEILRNCQSIILIKIVFSFSSIFFLILQFDLLPLDLSVFLIGHFWQHCLFQAGLGNLRDEAREGNHILAMLNLHRGTEPRRRGGKSIDGWLCQHLLDL